MQFDTSLVEPRSARRDCLIVGICDDGSLLPAAQTLDKASGGLLTAAFKSGDIRGKTGDTLLLRNLPGVTSERVILAGCGRPGEIPPRDYAQVLQASLKQLSGSGATTAGCYLTELKVAGRDALWQGEQIAQTATLLAYRFEDFKTPSRDGKPSRRNLKRVSVWCDGKAAARKRMNRALAEGAAAGNGANLARELGDLPANVCTPSYLASRARSMAKRLAMRAQILDEKAMAALGMQSLLSVGRGSSEPSRLVVLHYQGAEKKSAPIVLVGKGITFDSGGISIKPSAAMDEMKYDMCGAASVLGTLQAVAELQLPINVVGVMPCAENLPDGKANKPGDIVKSLDGKTIEILNTDAEGRLVLCDALTWSRRLKPSRVIDIATLTGACIVALGNQASGLLANDDELARELLEAGTRAHDRAWQLPLWEEYQEQLKSPFADVANVGGRGAGTITAACFLARFTENLRWAHLDIAGTAWKTGQKKGSTGRPVPLLTRYLIDQATRDAA